MYEVMARRYRPALFDEVVGQEHIAATLKNAITRDRVAHAYIFTGGHGCGKTTMARILAKALVCQNGPTPQPCGVCPICLDVAAGRDSDVLEIDGASNNGIEQIRLLREQAAYVPTRARYKIYIIDEVHMLSDGAFNALLKTLEEPPRHVKFILATTDPHKVPDTILSRCQRFDFRLVPQGKLAGFFRTLATQEKAAISDDALEAVAAFAEGSVRDGLVLLDQLLSFSDGEVTRVDVESVRGVASSEIVAGLCLKIAAGDAAGALAVVDEVASRGTNVGDFLDQLISFGRDLMVFVAGKNEEVVSAYGPARQTLLQLAANTSLETALLYLDVFTQARTRVRSRALSNPLVSLEMAVARLAGLGGVTPVAEILQQLSGLPAANRALPVRTRASAPAEPVAAPAPEVPLEPEPAPVPAAEPIVEPVKPEPAPTPEPAPSVEPSRPEPVAMPFEPDFSDEPEPEYEPMPVADEFVPMEPARQPEPLQSSEPAQPSAAPAAPAGSLTLDEVMAGWSKILDLLTDRHPADMRHIIKLTPEGVEEGAIVLAGTSTMVDAYNDELRLSRLRECAADVLRRPVEFRFVARKAKREAPVDNKARTQLARHPAVDTVRSLFDGVIVDCQPAAAPALEDEADSENEEDA
ncbi:MAG: DNA polymerase III subunit gamma/tau [Planctomycetaceae bacterium]|nr:DNA polymerase III subunit gamma/tau [Planctomycetaceae bacterium]